MARYAPAPVYYYDDAKFQQAGRVLAGDRSFLFRTVAYTPDHTPLNAAILLNPGGQEAGRWQQANPDKSESRCAVMKRIESRSRTEQSAALVGFHFVTTAVVNWADQDPLQHVNHKVFLGWMESNRIAYFERIGLWSDNPAGGIGIILAAISCNYRMPPLLSRPCAHRDRGYEDWSTQHRNAASGFQRKSARIAADSESTVVVYDYGQGQSCAIPEAVREALKENRFAQE